MSLTREQAARIIYARQSALDSLVGYARYMDIPGVPLDGDVSDRAYRVVETGLARHHLLILNCLQLMVEGKLRYDPATLMGSMTWDQIIGYHDTPAPPAGVESGPPPPVPKAQPPSGNSPKTSSLPITPSVALNGTAEPYSEIGCDAEPTKVPENTGIYPDSEGNTDTSHQLLPTSFTGICRRVMFMLPPGSAKSTYVSVVFPTWVMGKAPMFETILTGWGDPICQRNGKRARQMVSNPAYKELFGTGLDPKTTAANDWTMLNASSYKSSGIQSGIAGFRTQGLIWDDLTKNRKEADSPGIRGDVYNAYIDDARSRKTPDAWEVGVGTRWHENDVMGQILPEGYKGESGFIRCQDGNVWFVVCVAAECERADDPLGREIGEMLWAEWFIEGYWDDKRKNPRSWASLYQQRPAPDEGLYFKKEWFKTYRELPPDEQLTNYISYDPAVTGAEDDDNADFTAICVWGIDPHGHIYLRESWVRQVTMDVWIQQLLMLAVTYKPQEIISETGVIRRASEPFLKRAMRHLKQYFQLEWVTRHADKSAMARPAQAMMSSGQVFLPKNSDGDEMRDELLRFPTAAEDHRVDAFANLCLRLEQIWEKALPVPKEEKTVILDGNAGISIKSLMPPRFDKKVSKWAYRRNG